MTTALELYPPQTQAHSRWPYGRLLGERHVEMVAWESFGAGWITDVAQQLKIEHSVHIRPVW